MASVRDIDLAQRAQQRGFVSAEQLREAQQFAAGGRSVLSVLLDLGHLKADDLLRLAAAPAARSNRIYWIVTLAALGVALLLAVLPRAVDPQVREVYREREEASFSEQATARGRDLLADVERRLDARGRPPAAADRDLRRAAALLEEGSRAEDLLSLARIRELLDDWEGSRDLYQRALAEGSAPLPALLGAARTSLLLRDTEAAHAHADRACSFPRPAAEALYLRGAAALALGRNDAARADLAEAARLDSSFRPRVESIISGKFR